jgi:dsDNA-specific endonuclease/ATPase MutS2
MLTEDNQTEAARKMAEAFGDSYLRGVRNVVDSQQRSVQLAQGWVEGLTGVMQSQAETNRAFTRAMDNLSNVVGEAIESQERTARALSESLESYKEVVEQANETQEKNARLVESLLGGVSSELQKQSQGNEQMMQEMLKDSEQQVQSFQKMLAEATDSYAQLMAAPFSLYKKNLEAWGKPEE